jgi:hypothetical protein
VKDKGGMRGALSCAAVSAAKLRRPREIEQIEIETGRVACGLRIGLRRCAGRSGTVRRGLRWRMRVAPGRRQKKHEDEGKNSKHEDEGKNSLLHGRSITGEC